MTEETPPKPKKARIPKEPTSKWLRDQALRYLNRFPATTFKMRQHLMTRAAAGAELFDVDDAELGFRIEAEIARLVASGFINDREFAASKARVMARQGKSVTQIELRLQGLGFTEEDQENALEELGEDRRALDLAAAARYVKRRKFGPYKPARTREARDTREMASLARSGFSYDVARTVLDADKAEEIEDLIRGEG
ncbi:regulatory protein RecX [Sneathiella sp.]|uniref:regulatory protein RecX n=1 Tax=Sneathiella sp. TaxID=1964365 RepID=UPI003569D0BA